MRQFKIHWQTTPAPNLPFYQGTQIVWTEDEEEAKIQALLLVRRQSFPDWSGIGHLKVSNVEEV